MVTQYFPPDGATVFPGELVEELSARGHVVKVVTTYPHYTDGKVSHGYRQQLFTDEEFGGAQVRRVPCFASHSRNPISRMANYLTFAFSARFASGFIKEADVIYVYGAPATVAEPARVWSKKLGIPFVYHVEDIWPESVTESGFLPKQILDLMKQGINFWLTKVYRSASAVIAIAPSAKTLLISRGVPEDRAHLVYNWSDRVTGAERPDSDGLNLLYAGNLGDFQDLDTVVSAMQLVADLPGIHLSIVGSGVAEKRLKDIVASLSLQDVVTFYGHVERKEIPAYYAQADFQIVSLKGMDFFTATIPSKFQTGLAYGMPVITTVRGDVSDLVKKNQIGIVAEPENRESLAAAYRHAYGLSGTERAEYSARAVSFFTQHFVKDRAIDQIESILVAAAQNHDDESSKEQDRGIVSRKG